MEAKLKIELHLKLRHYFTLTLNTRNNEITWKY